jgi:hypothetical protein
LFFDINVLEISDVALDAFSELSLDCILKKPPSFVSTHEFEAPVSRIKTPLTPLILASICM